MDMNTFAMSTEKGFLSNVVNNNVLPCRIYASSVATFYGATAVKLIDTSEKEITVEKAGPTDKIFGFITFNSKKNKYIAGDRVNVAFTNSVMNMEVGASVLAGAELEQVATGDKVITNAGTNTKVGIALRKATADGDIIPVLIKTAGVSQNIASGDLPAISFLDLSDTPSAYTSEGDSPLKVNTGETALEFDIPTMAFTDLSDTPATLTGALAGLRVNAGETALELGLPAIAFTDLTDTPSTYDGSASDTVKVNGTNDGLIFVTV